MTEDEPRALGSTRGSSVPVPDPTLLTTQQLIREIKALQDIIDAKLIGTEKSISALERLINEKIECVANKSDERHRGIQLQFTERDIRFGHEISGAMEVARAARQALENKTLHVQELHDEKFASVAKQFEQRDVALLSTLNATKETFREQQLAAGVAIAKSEASTVKAIDQIQVLLQTATNALEGKISDIKDRLTAIESAKAGQVAQRVETQGSQVQWVGIMGLVLGGVVGLGGILLALAADREPAAIPERVVIEQAPTAGTGLR